jgi:hypothetical protein
MTRMPLGQPDGTPTGVEGTDAWASGCNRTSPGCDNCWAVAQQVGANA